VGELAALASSVLWAFASILWTGLGRRTAPAPLNLLKTGLATLLLALFLPVAGARFDAPPADLLLLAASGVLGLTLGDTAWFHALQRIGPRRTLLLWAMTPFVTALMAWPLLGEPLSVRLAAAMAVTVAGVLLVVGDRSEAGAIRGSLAIGVLFALLAVAAQAGSNVAVKMAGSDIGALSSSVLRLAAGTLGLGVQLGLLGRLAEAAAPLREPRGLATVLVATITGTVLGIFCSVYGVLNASQVAVASTLSSLSPVFVLPLSWWMLGERFGGRAVAGALVAVSGVAWLSAGGPPAL
jgi:drug/metabolite transporter (DMT)-like permease